MFLWKMQVGSMHLEKHHDYHQNLATDSLRPIVLLEVESYMNESVSYIQLQI